MEYAARDRIWQASDRSEGELPAALAHRLRSPKGSASSDCGIDSNYALAEVHVLVCLCDRVEPAERLHQAVNNALFCADQCFKLPIFDVL